jgi:hypothetical protein
MILKPLLLGLLVAPLAFAANAPERPEDLMIVDCLLPGQVRRLGRRATFMTPRRPAKTTAFDCQVRGGEFVSFDRADYATALQVWLEPARTGDAAAQYYVGQIYEKGLGAEPDYAAAAEWYRKAADQNHSAAQVSLGHLYETGLGVAKDPAAALHWYRAASGLPADMVVLESSEYDELKQLREEVRRKQEEIDSLRRQLDEHSSRSDAEREDLQRRIKSLDAELARASARIAAAQESEDGDVAPASFRTGHYRALLIENSDYRFLPRLDSGKRDLSRLAAILRERFGFRVDVLENATRFDVMNALNKLREELTENDHLLLFYSGHGRSEPEKQAGWWLPVDAEPDNRANWLSNRVIAEHLNLVAARHVLVLADSCYEGALTRSSIPVLPHGLTPGQRAERSKEMLRKRARLALTSGEDNPEIDARGSSVFTSAIIQSLERSRGVLEATTLYREINSTITSGRNGMRPVLAPIRFASHEGSDFFFVAGR